MSERCDVLSLRKRSTIAQLRVRTRQTPDQTTVNKNGGGLKMFLNIFCIRLHLYCCLTSTFTNIYIQGLTLTPAKCG